MGKIARRDLVGNSAAAIAINSVATVSLCNTGAATETYTVQIRRVDNTLHTIADGNIAADSDALTLESVSVYAGEYVELVASNNVLGTVSLLQETTTASGSLSRDFVTYVVAVATDTFALPANAPANNKKEVFVYVDGAKISPNEYELDASKTNIVFDETIYAGGDVFIELWKTEA